MKKKRRMLCFPRGSMRKILLKMKLLTVLMLAVFAVSAADSYSQATKFNISLNNVTVREVFKQIEEKSEFILLYNEKSLDVNREVNVNVKDQSVESVLDQVFEGVVNTYKIYDRQIVILENQNSELPLIIGGKAEQPDQKEISGTVKDSNGLPLPGVTVMVKGTTVGIITNSDGEFQLTVPNEAQILVFSFVGMKGQEVVIGVKSNFSIVLEEDYIGLEEVIAVGYGTQTKRSVTGSIQTITSDDLIDIPVAQVTQTLQGKVTGVQINQNTGVPGQAMQIRVRGQGSISAGSDPLYVIDGFPITGNLSDINPDEIESITIMKDAASTSLYGSRAANGVILIETKHAKTGQTKIGFSSYYGVQTLPQAGRPEMMNGQEFAQFKKESYEDLGQTVPAAFQNPAQYGAGYDWYDIMFRAAPVQNYSLSLSTGSEKFSTSAVAGYFNQEGILLNSGYERFSLRVNSEFKVNKQLRLGFNVAPTVSKNFTPSNDAIFWQGGLLYNSLLTWPIVPYKNEDGTLPLSAWIPGISAFPAPNYYRAAQEIKTTTENLKLLSNAYIEWEPISDLVLKSSVNLQLNSANSKFFNPSTSSTGFATAPPITARAEYGSSWALSWLLENTATYSKVIKNHRFVGLAGYSTQKFQFKSMDIAATNFPDDRINDVDAATELQFAGTDSDTQEWSLLSYLARVNYDYKGKYMASLAIRRDGSSRFGVNNRWGNFPSVSVGWIVSEEDFFPKDGLFSLVKTRASWGITGNNNIGNYTHYALVNLGENAIFGNSVAGGTYVDNLSNAELGWETTKQLDIGIDVAILNNRIDLSYDYYTKSTTNLLYDFNIPASSGFTTFTGNSGELRFWGHEISIQSRNMVGEFKWNTNFNISFNDNEVISLADNVDAIYGGGHITKVGERLGLFWGLEHDGVYVNQQDYDSSPKASRSAVGTVKFKDNNNDGEVLNTDTGGDRVVIGDPTPTFLLGMTNTFAYKNFDLSITMSGSVGNDIANRFEQGTTNLDGVFNVLKEVENRWRSPENPGDGLYGTTTTQTGMERDWFNSRFIEDGSYLTIKNITLGYNLDVSRIKFLSNVRIYASAQQVYTFTKYSGNNPEVGTTISGETASVLYLGDDYAAYPVPRTFTFGVNVGF